MPFTEISIQSRLMRAFLLIGGMILMLTSITYFSYEYITFKNITLKQLSILGRITASNSTAAVAFGNDEEAYEILAALQAQPYIIEANIYDAQDQIFAHYPREAAVSPLPAKEGKSYQFSSAHIIGVEPIIQGDSQLGLLYIRADLRAMYARLKLFGVVTLAIILTAVIMAFAISKRMQRKITKPILTLADTAKTVSRKQDYSVRAVKLHDDEIGQLTDSFNRMLTEIEYQNQEIQSLNNNLEEKVEKRTKELASSNAQLAATNKELEAFSYSVSHDLRAPLRSVHGYSKILVEEYANGLNEEMIKLLGIIMRNALKMGRLIDDLLSFSRVGKQNLIKIPLKMDELTATVVNDFSMQQYQNSRIIIKELLPVEADSSMLRQVMTNLVSNALKYSGKKKNPVIEIGSYQEAGNNVYYVKDNGAGFDMQYYDKLFGVFKRLHGDNEFEGTGVGLALVQRIIAKHEGKIWAEGKVDEGATFYFSLPSQIQAKARNKKINNKKSDD